MKWMNSLTLSFVPAPHSKMDCDYFPLRFENLAWKNGAQQLETISIYAEIHVAIDKLERNEKRDGDGSIGWVVSSLLKDSFL